MEFINKHLKKIISVLLVAICLFSLTACASKTERYVDKSLKSVKGVTLSVVVKDGDETVYSMDKQIDLIKGGANVTTETKRLNPNDFALKSETLSEFVADLTAKDVLRLNLSKDVIDGKKKSNVYNGTVEKTNANVFFSVEDARAGSDVTVKITFKRRKLQTIDLFYTLTSGRTVEMSAVYTY